MKKNENAREANHVWHAAGSGQRQRTAAAKQKKSVSDSNAIKRQIHDMHDVMGQFLVMSFARQ